MDLEDLVRLRRARDTMDRDYAEPLDVPALARVALMSPGHFSRSFRAAYGETPYSYLMTRRIERAKMLLRRGDLTVTEVCFEVGCTSLGSFSSRFTELVGESPSAYRDRDHDDERRDPGVRRQDAHATDQEWRSEAGRPPVACAAWTSSFRTCFIPVDDHDKALAFYRDMLGLEVRNDVNYEGMRWVTVGSPSQPDVEIVLEPPVADPNAPEPTSRRRGAAREGPAARRDLPHRRLRRDVRADPRRRRRGAAGADGHALRRPRLRVPRPRRQHAPLQPA